MPTTIAMLLFDRITILDLIGPYEVLSKIPDVTIKITALEKRLYHDRYGLKVAADYACDEVSQADVLLLPGGQGVDTLIGNPDLMEWIRKIDKTTSWTTSVCSGSLLLADAGLLNGRRATTHWRRKQQLSSYGLTVVNERYVEDGKYMTSAGVSAGIDMALYLAAKISGPDIARMIQLSIEYDPHPPFDCGSISKAPDHIIRMLK